MTTPRYTLIPGRCILLGGKPLVAIVKAGYTEPKDADALAELIVDLLNQDAEVPHGL